MLAERAPCFRAFCPTRFLPSGVLAPVFRANFQTSVSRFRAARRALASLLIGVLQTFAVGLDHSFVSVAQQWGVQLSDAALNNSVLKLTLSQVAPILPYLFLVLILIFRPKGLLGTREG